MIGNFLEFFFCRLFNPVFLVNFLLSLILNPVWLVEIHLNGTVLRFRALKISVKRDSGKFTSIEWHYAPNNWAQDPKSSFCVDHVTAVSWKRVGWTFVKAE